MRSTSDYSGFGVQLDGRTSESEGYRYGFNGMEKDDEIKGPGNSYDFGARMYDARVGRWMKRDPLETNYPNLSTYSFVANNPLVSIDPDGERIIWVVKGKNKFRRYCPLVVSIPYQFVGRSGVIILSFWVVSLARFVE
jgi:RHS repeat-associated protein